MGKSIRTYQFGQEPEKPREIPPRLVPLIERWNFELQRALPRHLPPQITFSPAPPQPGSLRSDWLTARISSQGMQGSWLLQWEHGLWRGYLERCLGGTGTSVQPGPPTSMEQRLLPRFFQLFQEPLKTAFAPLFPHAVTLEAIDEAIVRQSTISPHRSMTLLTESSIPDNDFQLILPLG